MEKQRFKSLDVFRGADIALMIIVNTPGDYGHTFAPLHHAKWHGFTVTDLVFPTFLFVVGASMSLSIPAQLQLGDRAFLSKVFKRTLILFLLGYLMYWFPFFFQDADGIWHFKKISETRILGVLQRIALCYGLSALLIRYLSEKALVLFAVGALAGYWLILSLFGDLTLEGNAVRKFDLWVMGAAHLYDGNGLPFDPEGLLSTLPAIVNVLAGYWACRYLRQKSAGFETVSMLMIGGAILAFAGLAWDLLLPMNKKLWTSSFVVYTTGLDLMILGSLVYWIDIRQHTRWTNFFEIMGRNPITIYLISEYLAILLFTIPVGDMSLYGWVFRSTFSWLPDYFASLAFAVVFMLVCWSVGWWMDRKKIYWKV